MHKQETFWIGRETSYNLSKLWKTLQNFGLRQFITTGSPLKMMKNGFYFMSKAFFVLKILKFLSWPFGHIGKWLHKKAESNFKIYDVTDWTWNNDNTHIVQYLKKYRQSGNAIWPDNRI